MYCCVCIAMFIDMYMTTDCISVLPSIEPCVLNVFRHEFRRCIDMYLGKRIDKRINERIDERVDKRIDKHI